MERKILIVDDDYAFAEYARMLLEEEGYGAIVSLEGEKAVGVAAAEKPDLILMDMNLGDINGDEAIRRLKARPETAGIPILLCSITQKSSEIQAALACGAAGFLPKPLKRAELGLKVRETLGLPGP